MDAVVDATQNVKIIHLHPHVHLVEMDVELRVAITQHHPHVLLVVIVVVHRAVTTLLHLVVRIALIIAIMDVATVVGLTAVTTPLHLDAQIVQQIVAQDVADVTILVIMDVADNVKFRVVVIVKTSVVGLVKWNVLELRTHQDVLLAVAPVGAHVMKTAPMIAIQHVKVLVPDRQLIIRNIPFCINYFCLT